RDEGPACDSGAGREPLTDERLCALPGDRLEDELVRLGVEQEDRRRSRLEDRTGDLGSRLEQRAVSFLGAEHAGRDRRLEVTHRARSTPSGGGRSSAGTASARGACRG